MDFTKKSTGKVIMAKVVASITKRVRKRRLRSGALIKQTRFVVNFREPRSGRRQQFFFGRHKDAIAKRDKLLSEMVMGTREEKAHGLTVGRAVEYWIENRRTEVKKGTWDSYRVAARNIVGPLLHGSKSERYRFTRRGVRRTDAQLIEMLGPKRVSELTTGDIRNWHKTLSLEVSTYTANVAKKFLRAALALAAEDFNLRVPCMPTQLGNARNGKTRKMILTPRQVGMLIEAAQQDSHRGLYYAFPFLTGVRPSEQLGLLWEDIDLDNGVLHIRRMQERDCSITEFTKTAAGMRTIPISPLLKAMLVAWRCICPQSNDQPHRVFPTLGNLGSRSRRHGSKVGGPLSYENFRRSYWLSALRALGLPYVTPHSARHTFISTLQARGVEVGLVAKLAGHANATVTLGVYTQAVRGGETAIGALEHAYTAGNVAPPAIDNPPLGSRD
jgi:integrase